MMMRTVAVSALLVAMLGACTQAETGETDIVEVADAAEAATWPPSDEEEALYNQRFEALLAAFASGAATTTYDTLGPVRGAALAQQGMAIAVPGLDRQAADAAAKYAGDNNSKALIVYQGGEILHESYFGGADKDTLIVGKSLAKPLGAVAVGRAIQAGKIDGLDQPVADFITEWQGTDKDKILVRHLLDMRTGLLPQGQAPDRENILNRAYLHPRHDELIIHDYPLTDEPGARYEYSNANAELVAPLIERATGVQYEDWIADEVLTPLGAAGGEVWMNRPGGTAHAGCCMLLPARSWLKVAEAVMLDGVINGEAFLPDGYVTQMLTPTAQNSHSGMGVYIGQPYVEYRGFMNPEAPFGRSYHSEPYVDQDLVLFDGNSNQVVYIIPSKQLIVLRVGDSPPKEPVWDNAYLPNLVSRALVGE